MEKVFQASGEKINQIDKSMQSALHVACQSNNKLMIYKLLQHRSGYKMLYQKNCHNKTPSDLYHQPSSSSPNSVCGCAAYLAAYGADIIPISRVVEHSKLKSTPSVNVIVVGNSSVGKTTLAMLTGNNKELKPISTGIVTDNVVISDIIATDFAILLGILNLKLHTQNG